MQQFIRSFFPLWAGYCVWQCLWRVVLMLQERTEIGFLHHLLPILGKGILQDSVVFLWVLVPFLLYQCLVRGSWLHTKKGKRSYAVLYGSFLLILAFTTVAEWLFWDEFHSRFNFIAVDYLIYTHEVVGNIQESYPLPWLLSGIAAVSLLLFAASYRWILRYPAIEEVTIRVKMLFFVGYVLFISVVTYTIPFKDTPGANAYAQEIEKNGWYSLFSAFLHNRLDYDAFYPTMPREEAFATIRPLLLQGDDRYISKAPKDLWRDIKPRGKAQKDNVIIVVMESMSADFMARFGDTLETTPYLNQLAKESLLWTQLYATGTRTVKGLEALTLSIPPTPGNSIVRQPHNEGLFSLGYVFKEQGYATKFLYGGYGYFDNMNYFFSENHFSVIDRAMMTEEEVSFANIWGVCDEDLLRRTLKEADHDYQEKNPFLYMVMTTSNHRPYTYPEGKIDIAPLSGRYGGVKYADYAIGTFIKEAKTRPWFKDTLFVFVADHTAGSAGKVELDVKKYHIPALFYAPHKIKPRETDTLASQIDIPTTILGMLRLPYKSTFYGQNLFETPAKQRAFISNYQKLGYMTPESLVVLKPMAEPNFYVLEHGDVIGFDHSKNNAIYRDAIGYFSTAALWESLYLAP